MGYFPKNITDIAPAYDLKISILVDINKESMFCACMDMCM